MFAPRSDNETGLGRRFLQGTGLTAGVLFFAIVALILFVATRFFCTPTELYHRTWETAAEHIFDPSTLGNWQDWEHKFDGQIKTNEDAVKHANEMLKSLKDRYTYLQSPEQVSHEREQGQGNFSGVGMVFDYEFDENGKPRMTADGEPIPKRDGGGHPIVGKVLTGGPAAGAGIKSGDAITSINGNSTKDQTLEWMVKNVRGEIGTTVEIGINRAGVDITFSVRRDVVTIPAVTVSKIGKIGYLRLEDFSQFDAADEVEYGLDLLDDAEAIVFDLRGNPGGFVGNAIDISSLFVKEGTLVVIKSRIPGSPSDPQYETSTVKVVGDKLITETTSSKTGKTKTSQQKRRPYRMKDRPVVILVNGNSASASEMTTGAVVDNAAATVIGTRTFGKGIGQSSIPMPNWTQLHITSLRYYSPKGNWYGDGGNSVATGIEPNIIVKPNRQLFEFNTPEDNQLDEALLFLLDKLSGK